MKSVFLSYARVPVSAIIVLVTMIGGQVVHASEQPVDFHVESWTSNADTAATVLPDTTGATELPDSSYRTIRISKDSLESTVTYKATDSLAYDIANQQIILYGEAEVYYESIELRADQIILDWGKGEVEAYGRQDSIGQWIGRPVFTEGERTFTAQRMRYNFKSGRAKIYQVSTQEGEGYLLSEEAMREDDNSLYARRARFTTCDAEEPHFWIEASPIKVVPDQILVSGPGNLVLAGVRTPLVLPFALFPLQKGQRSGILIPEIGESQELGFALQNGGYYFGINEYVDLSVTGDLYTSGSYRVRLSSRYSRRYRYNGNLSLEYGNLRFGDALSSNLSLQRSFGIRWNYVVDPKAWPNNSFTANVNIASSNFNRLNVTNAEERLNNSFNSSINYSRNFRNKPFNFNMALRHSQNTSTRQVSLTLPEANFGISRINPFKRKISAGEPKWYEQIGFNYSMNTRNFLTITDSLFFREEALQAFRIGMQHQLPVSANFKVLKYFTLTPAINYTENWYLEEFVPRYDPVDIGDSVIQYVQIDTVGGFRPVRFFNTNIGLTTRLYGRLNFKKGKIRAIRHVVTPRISASYRPDFGAAGWGYFTTVQTDPDGNTRQFATFPTDLYGAPPQGVLGGIGLNINSNLEMKVFSKKDTVNQERKIKILDAFDVSTFYNLAKDSLQLERFRFSGRTTLLDRVNVVFSALYDPYVLNAAGTGNLNRFEIQENGRLLRLENADLNVSFRLAGDQGRSDDAEENPYAIPWNFNMRYSLRLDKGIGANLDSIALQQSLGFDLSFTLMPTWRVNLSSGFDFVKKEFTYTLVDISRDLHCWEMRFRWIPFGFLRSYTFGINVKSTILRDLKLEKKSNPYDNFRQF